MSARPQGAGWEPRPGPPHLPSLEPLPRLEPSVGRAISAGRPSKQVKIEQRRRPMVSDGASDRWGQRSESNRQPPALRRGGLVDPRSNANLCRTRICAILPNPTKGGNNRIPHHPDAPSRRASHSPRGIFHACAVPADQRIPLVQSGQRRLSRHRIPGDANLRPPQPHPNAGEAPSEWPLEPEPSRSPCPCRTNARTFSACSTPEHLLAADAWPSIRPRPVNASSGTRLTA